MSVSIKTNDMVKILDGDCKGQYGHVKDTTNFSSPSSMIAWVFLPDWNETLSFEDWQIEVVSAVKR